VKVIYSEVAQCRIFKMILSKPSGFLTNRQV